MMSDAVLIAFVELLSDQGPEAHAASRYLHRCAKELLEARQRMKKLEEMLTLMISAEITAEPLPALFRKLGVEEVYTNEGKNPAWFEVLKQLDGSAVEKRKTEKVALSDEH